MEYLTDETADRCAALEQLQQEYELRLATEQLEIDKNSAYLGRIRATATNEEELAAEEHHAAYILKTEE